MTDFGMKDGNVGVMKGVIWSICPEAQIADISHLVAAQNVREAALILARSVPYFPAGSIHLVVVDPGVGTERRPLAARIGSQYYVGPDNGATTLWVERARAEGSPLEFVELDRSEYWLPIVSHVFHGRDIFAPVAAHLAKGIALRALGSQVGDPVELEFPRPRRVRNGWQGEVIHIDHFGNVASNIQVRDLERQLLNKVRVQVQVGKVRINGLVNTFGERPAGEVVALFGSTGNLIVSVVNGDAAAALGVRVGESFRVTIQGMRNDSDGEAGG